LDRDFSSIDNQREAAEAFIASQRHEGWTAVPARYDDGGFSGGTMERPAIKQLLADVDAGLIDTIVVYKLDRLSRSLVDFGRIHEFLEKRGVALVSVTESINTKSPHGRMMVNVLLSFAQYERELIGERTHDKLAAARRRGKFVGGHPVLGFDLDPKGGQLLVNESEAEMVREIFGLFLEKRSLIGVVDELNRRAWTLKRWNTKDGKLYGGGRFDKASLRRLLTNYAYIGKVNFEGTVYDGEHQAILSPRVFREVQHILDGNRSNGGAVHRNRHGALLRGLVACASCNRAMTHTSARRGSKVYRYYVCQRAQKEGRASCPTGSLRADQIEQFVVGEIRRVGADPELQEATFRQAVAQLKAQQRGLRAEAKRLAKDLTSTKADVERLVGALSRSSGPAAEAIQGEVAKAQERMTVSEGRLAGVRAEEASLAAQTIDQAELARALEAFDPIWEVLVSAERERVLHLLIQQVRYDGSRMEIDWRLAGLGEFAREVDGG
jgi:site-specific DNA recombinase